MVAGRDDDTIIHEWGHAFAGLGDEYATFTVPRGEVGMSPNVSNTSDPDKVPWRHWLEADAPGIGVYRGGAGRLKGAWKPVASGCAMEHGQQFCRVCRETLVLRVYSLVDPIDGCEPAAHPTAGHSMPLRPGKARGFTFEVTILRPASHGLDVSWWVLDESEVPDPVQEGQLRDRRQRGPLRAIAVRPAKRLVNSRRRVHRFTWTPERGQNGRFRIVCRVRDATKVSGQSWPWVLRDERGVPESERGWWVRLGQ